jgi:hypothetical protein
MGRCLLKFRSKSIGYPFAGKSDVGGSAVLQAESVFSLAEGVLAANILLKQDFAIQ